MAKEGYESDPETLSDFDDDEDDNANALPTIANAAHTANAAIKPPSDYKIPLYAKDGSIVDYAYVDEEDFARVMQWRWWRTRQGYAQGYVNGAAVSLSRYVMKARSSNIMIDHKNRIKLDNTKANLREVTALQNALNKAKVMTEVTTSPYQGVYKKVLPSGKVRWIARICHRYLGCSHTQHEAAHMYNLEYMALSGLPDAPNNVLPVQLNPISKGPADLPQGVTIRKGRFSTRIDGKASYFDDKEEAIAARQVYEDELQKMRRAEVFSRPITVDEDGHAIITLTNGMKSKVDHNIWHEASLYNWYHVKGYACTSIGGRNVSLHRFAKGLGSPNKHTLPVVDHKNRNKLDNRCENLQETTWSVNAFNKDKKEGAQSKYYGVRTFPNGTFGAALRYEEVLYFLRTYDEDKLAAYAYDCKSELIHGVRRNGIELTGYKFVNDRVLPEGIEPRVKASKYTGVTRKAETWLANVRDNKITVHLGSYDSELEAACAVDCYLCENGRKPVNDVSMPEGYEWRTNRLIPKPGPDVKNLEEYYERWKPKIVEKTSPFIGVSLIKEYGKWEARQWHGSKSLFFGTYATQEEAAYAVDSWSADQKRPRPNGMESLDGFVWNSEKKRVEPAVITIPVVHPRLLEAENQDFIGVFRGKRVSPPSYTAKYYSKNLGTYRYKLLAAFAYDTAYQKAHPTLPRPNGIESVEGYKVLPDGKVVEEGVDEYKVKRKKM